MLSDGPSYCEVFEKKKKKEKTLLNRFLYNKCLKQKNNYFIK